MNEITLTSVIEFFKSIRIKIYRDTPTEEKEPITIVKEVVKEVVKEKIVVVDRMTTLDEFNEKMIDSWRVEWKGRDGAYSGNLTKEIAFFIDENVANAFAEELRKAFKLIRHTSETEVTVKKT